MRFPVTLRIKPSRRLRAALVFVHCLSALCLLSVDTGIYGMLGIVLLIASLVHCWQRLARADLKLAQDGRLFWLGWQGATTEERVGNVLAGSVAFSNLIALRIRLEGERRTRGLVILRDSLPPKDYRALQIWLRWVLPIKPSVESA
jgi:hypothetical protein